MCIHTNSIHTHLHTLENFHRAVLIFFEIQFVSIGSESLLVESGIKKHYARLMSNPGGSIDYWAGTNPVFLASLSPLSYHSVSVSPHSTGPRHAHSGSEAHRCKCMLGSLPENDKKGHTDRLSCSVTEQPLRADFWNCQGGRAQPHLV